MSVQLTTNLSEGFWHHNSGQEHAQKHFGDIAGINKLRLGRGLPAIPEDEFYDLMYDDGVVTVREDGGTKSGVGDVVGYFVGKRDKKSIDCIDFYVKDVYRGKAVGGFVLGKVITSREFTVFNRGFSLAHGPTELAISDSTYKLPGGISMVSADVVSGHMEELAKGLHDAKWSGVEHVMYGTESEDEDDYREEFNLYREGELLTKLNVSSVINKYGGMLCSASNVALFVAIEHLNPDAPIKKYSV